MKALLLLPMVALLLAVPAATGQISSSANFQLEGLSFDAVAGGASSENTICYVQMGPLEFERMVSPAGPPSFQADISFLAAYDPDPGIAPILWRVLPAHTDKAGGAAMAFHGRNLGAGLSPAVSVGGTAIAATDVSDSLLTATSPGGDAGLADVDISHANGAVALAGGHIFSPAVISPEFATPDSLWRVYNYGPTGGLFQPILALDVLPSSVGTACCGQLWLAPPLFFLSLLPYGFPDPAAGVTSYKVRIENNPAIIGFSIYIQNLDSPSGLTNFVSLTFQ